MFTKLRFKLRVIQPIINNVNNNNQCQGKSAHNLASNPKSSRPFPVLSVGRENKSAAE